MTPGITTVTLRATQDLNMTTKIGISLVEGAIDTTIAMDTIGNGDEGVIKSNRIMV